GWITARCARPGRSRMLLWPILTRSRVARAKPPEKNRGLRIENRRSRMEDRTIPIHDLRFSFFGLSILNSQSSTLDRNGGPSWIILFAFTLFCGRWSGAIDG